jgi:putative membrane protein
MNSLRLFAAIASLLISVPLLAARTASDTDKSFVAKVSQGGAYEVEASKLAALRAHAQDIKDIASHEIHDHLLVGARLKRTYVAAGLKYPTTLNPEFTARLAKLKAVPAADFDAAYIADMDQIHDKDEKLFAQEANDGSGDFKSFAAETDRIVKRHIGALHAF